MDTIKRIILLLVMVLVIYLLYRYNTYYVKSEPEPIGNNNNENNDNNDNNDNYCDNMSLDGMSKLSLSSGCSDVMDLIG
ncbi:hypothetical protein Hokovirus_4_87 [Hokovirus HKV1]|uniref:Uncharacterized protein n=1 Tax=Hokovirus HKV1 TaxID=1977638 RepID=A0A1V0SHD1_9VIRU|nr:hypothetical protein Hokovirus_4_87 [Hokovirus HKV1]